jgi:hypothetical protein
MRKVVQGSWNLWNEDREVIQTYMDDMWMKREDCLFKILIARYIDSKVSLNNGKNGCG